MFILWFDLKINIKGIQNKVNIFIWIGGNLIQCKTPLDKKFQKIKIKLLLERMVYNNYNRKLIIEIFPSVW